MGGIYIPGMEMPKRDTTFLVHVNGDTIDLTPPRKYAEEHHREREIYKLLPVLNHGRLIDADTLEYEEVYLNGHYALGDVEIIAREDIESAPTIIPADKEADA